MEQPVCPTPARRQRLLGLEAWQVLAGSALVVLLAFALHPDPRGYGTHTQLFLPPCGFHWLTHVPCPFCGMTTGFALMARGRVPEAARANILAPAAFLATVLLGLCALRGTLRGGEWLPPWLFDVRLPRALLVLLGCSWVVNIIIHTVVL